MLKLFKQYKYFAVYMALYWRTGSWKGCRSFGSHKRGSSVNFITRSPAVAKIADLTGCQWPSRSSKVDDFHVVWKPIYDFLSM